MESPVEVWVSLSVAVLSVVGFLPSEAQSTTCVSYQSSSLGETFAGGFIALLMMALFLAVLFYAARKPSSAKLN